MSILRYKKYALADGGVLRADGGGSGGSSGPTSSTTNTSNIPDYAQPYVMNMLQAAQSQVFNKDMTGMNPYQPYSNNPSDYVAGFSPLQQQAQSAAANLQVPGQYKQATQAASQGIGQALGAGQNYANMATDPSQMQKYMNPYVQQSLQPQLNLLAQQGGIQSAAQQGAATSAGAFGGSRSALANALAGQNNLMAQQSAIGQGYNQAYQQAQQAQQFGANLGLQGAQAGIAGAGQLAGIGGQELAARQGIIGTQSQQGGIQQGQQQKIIDQAINTYATGQQYPMMQLANMSGLLRGLPLQATSTQTYQAPPNQVSQLAGLGLTGAAAYGLAKKKGGKIDEKEGSGLADLQLHKLMGKKV